MSVKDVLKGGIDLHTHSSPSIFPRKMTDWEMIEEARSKGLGGIVLKSHESSTVERAQVISMVEKEIKVLGGIVLNYFVGGLNPSAVDVALKLGGKFVWMPTISSEQHMNHFRGKEGRLFAGVDDLRHPDTGISILDHQGQLKDEVYEILDLVKKYDAVLCSGHIAASELKILADAVFERNIERFLINHPDMGIAPVPLTDQIELAKRGAFLEKCYLATTSEFNSLTVETMCHTIKEIGASQCVLVTDFGQAFNISPIQAMEQFINELLKYKISEEEIIQMYVQNPNKLVF